MSTYRERREAKAAYCPCGNGPFFYVPERRRPDLCLDCGDRDDLIEARRIIRCAIAATKANISNGTVPTGTWLSEARAFLERTERTDTPPAQEAQ